MKSFLPTVGLLLMSCACFAQTAQPSITTGATLPAGTTGTAYSVTLAATGGSGAGYSFGITVGTTGQPPDGLSLSAGGTISGTPTSYGISTFSVTVTDSNGLISNPVTFSLTVNPGPLTITTTSPLPSGLTETPYSQTLAATGGIPPYSWALTAGGLPAGLTLSAAGVVSGNASVAGVASFTATVTDSNASTASQTFSVSINIAPLAISTPTTLPAGLVSTPYSQTLATTGGLPPYTWVLTSPPSTLPPGITLSSAGVLSGTPTAAGTFSPTIEVIDTAVLEAASLTFSLTTASTGVSIATPSILPSGSVTTPYSQALAAAGGVSPYTWSLTSGALPAGLALSAGGVISGTPTASGNFNFTAQVQDTTALTASQAFTMTVTAAGVLPRLGILSQLSAGAGWTTTIWLINRSAAPVQTNLVFHGDDGTPLQLPLTVTQPTVTMQLESSSLTTTTETIAPNTTLVVATQPLASNVEGWVDVLTNGALSGFAVYSNGSEEASVPLQSLIETSFSLYFDNTNGASTGVAVANLAGAPATITATVWDMNGNLVTLQPVAVPLTQNDANGNGHDSFMLPGRIAATANIRGIIQFQGNPATASVPAGQLTGLGLRTEANNLFTSIPTIVP
jgi:hypothetical protein